MAVWASYIWYIETVAGRIEWVGSDKNRLRIAGFEEVVSEKKCGIRR